MRRDCCYKCNKQLQISLFQEEKIVLFIEYFQLLGFTITMFWETWPQKLRREAGWLMLFNLDFLTYNYGLHQFVANYDLVFFNALGWAIALGIITGCFLLLKFFRVISLINSRAPHFCVRWISNSLQMLILPILINTLPYGFYTFSTQRVDIVEVNVWQKKEQFILLILAALVCAILVLGFILMCCHIKKYAIYYTDDKHEQFLKQKELQYTLEISNLWRFKHFYLFSSFRRSLVRVYHRNIKWWIFWFNLVLVHSVTGSVNPLIKPLAAFLLVLSWFLICLFRPPYRLTSTSLLYLIMIFGVGFNIFLALSRAIGVRSALLIDQNISYVLYALNGVAIFFLVVLMIVFGAIKKWTWPLNEEYILENVKRYMRYVKNFKEARNLIQRIHIKEGNFLKNEARLNYTIESYQKLYEEIKNDFQHILNQLVLELLQELRLAKVEMQQDRRSNGGEVPPSVEELLQLQVDARKRVLE